MIHTVGLQVKGLYHSFSQGLRTVTVLKNVTYLFKRGSSYALTGPSGAGKSTLLYCMAGLETPMQGQVLLDGIDLATLSAKKRAQILQQHIGVIFQVPHLIDELSVIENVMIKGLIAHQEYAAAHTKAQKLLLQVGLGGKEYQRPRSLSGGEQQRVSVARALFSEPSFILADEPTAHLDSATAQDILELLRTYQQEKNAGLIIASHDTSLVDMLDTVLELKDGSLIDVLHSQAVEE